MRPLDNEKGQGAGTPKPQAATYEATAKPAYSSRKLSGKRESGYNRPCSAEAVHRRSRMHKTAFKALDGRIWRYTGKRARVLDMLVHSSNGVTQHDCLPWHTRLGASIHAMREDGLVIDTELEGEFRHVRYRLCPSYGFRRV